MMKVTRYMAIKWIKAAFEIVVAIIIIVFEGRIMMGVPSDAADKAVFQLFVALIWFLVIWCIIAAVRNIILSLRPEPKNSLQTLNEKIDALDKKLVSMGLASETVPEATPPSPEELKKGRNKKIMVAAGIVAAIVVLAAISMVFLIPMLGGGGNPGGGATPEDTLTALISAMNSKGANGVLSLTVYSFGNATIKSQYRQSLNEIFSQGGGSFHVTMNSHQVKYPTDLNASDNSDLTGIQNDIQNHISNTITASCMVVFNMSITVNQSSFYQSGNMPCFQIDAGWYVLLDFGNNGPGPGGNQSGSPTDAFDSFIDRVRQKDGTGAVDYTIFSFGNDTVRMDTEKRISEWWNNTGTFQVTVNSRYEISGTSLNSNQQNNLSNIQGNLSSKFGIFTPVQESCFVGYDITITSDSGPLTVTGFMPCFKVSDSWYVMPEQSGGGPQGATITMTQGSTATNWTLTVNNVNLAGGPPLLTSDVYLTVKYANGTKSVNMTLDNLMGVGWFNGTSFTDNGVLGQIDNGDVLLLDSTIYQINSIVKLRNSDGTQIYYELPIT